MIRYVLAGDVGGTKTQLAVYAFSQSGALTLVRTLRYASQDYDRLETLVQAFLQEGCEPIEASAFGLPGPVLEGEVKVTNLPWKVSVAGLSQAIHCTRLRLMNDLEITAYGSLFLGEREITTLNPGKPRRGHRAIIAAGTGLGQAFLFWDGARYWTAATEGGHTDFAPRTDQETALLTFLRKRFGRVSYERVVAGSGLVNIFHFLRESEQKPVSPLVLERLQTEDPAAVIGESGLHKICSTCSEAVDIFLSIYGAQAGNLALTVMALGGVYIGGGIITKLLPRVASSNFMSAFLEKGRHAAFMADIPVHVIMDPYTSQLGAAHAAKELL